MYEGTGESGELGGVRTSVKTDRGGETTSATLLIDFFGFGAVVVMRTSGTSRWECPGIRIVSLSLEPWGICNECGTFVAGAVLVGRIAADRLLLGLVDVEETVEEVEEGGVIGV